MKTRAIVTTLFNVASATTVIFYENQYFEGVLFAQNLCGCISLPSTIPITPPVAVHGIFTTSQDTMVFFNDSNCINQIMVMGPFPGSTGVDPIAQGAVGGSVSSIQSVIWCSDGSDA
jgi:hypothetical protein